MSSHPQWSPSPGSCMSGWPTISSLQAFPPTLRCEGLKVQWGPRNNLRCELVRSPQANWRPSLGLLESTGLRVSKPPLHCGGVPSHRGPSPVASLHSDGHSHHCGRGTRFWSRWLACLFTSPGVRVIWFLADGWLGRRPPGPMPQLRGGMRHGLGVSGFPDFWPFGGTGILPRAALAVLGRTLGVEFRAFWSYFFLHIHKQKKAMEAMNHSGQPRNSGKGGQCGPLPLALEEVTCGGWGPHLQYSF